MHGCIDSKEQVRLYLVSFDITRRELRAGCDADTNVLVDSQIQGRVLCGTIFFYSWKSVVTSSRCDWK